MYIQHKRKVEEGSEHGDFRQLELNSNGMSTRASHIIEHDMILLLPLIPHPNHSCQIPIMIWNLIK